MKFNLKALSTFNLITPLKIIHTLITCLYIKNISSKSSIPSIHTCLLTDAPPPPPPTTFINWVWYPVTATTHPLQTPVPLYRVHISQDLCWHQKLIKHLFLYLNNTKLWNKLYRRCKCVDLIFIQERNHVKPILLQMLCIWLFDFHPICYTYISRSTLNSCLHNIYLNILLKSTEAYKGHVEKKIKS